MSDLRGYRREGWLGTPYHFFPQTGSTNDLASQAGQEGVPEGALFITGEQLTGRGRFDRKWSAPPGCCLLLSLLFRPREPFAHNASRITMACGLAMQRAIRQVSGVPALLKWPNDVIVEQTGGYGKLAGMLSEIGLVGEQAAFLVVGIGLNVNIEASLLPSLGPQAMSLSAACGHNVSRRDVLDVFLNECERLIDALRDGRDLYPQWRTALAWMGQLVGVTTPQGETIHGVLHDVVPDGSLVLRMRDGTQRMFSAGDVSLRPG